MPRIKILKAQDSLIAPQVNGVAQPAIPVDGEFHEASDDALPFLDDCGVTYEIENVEAREAAASAGGAGRGFSAPLSPFDHDGDGKPGGSKRGGLRKRIAKVVAETKAKMKKQK